MCSIFGSGLDDPYEESMMAKDLAPRLEEVDELERALMANEVDHPTICVEVLEDELDEEALWLAAEEGDVEVVERCCGVVDVNAVDDTDRYSAILIASESGHLAVVRKLCELGATVDQRDAFGRTPLYAAAVSGKLAVAEFLIASSALIEAADEDGRTPLWSSCATRQLEAAALLLRHGADLEVRDRRGLSPLDFASLNGHADVIAFLQQRGAATPCSRLRDVDGIPATTTATRDDTLQRIMPDRPLSLRRLVLERQRPSLGVRDAGSKRLSSSSLAKTLLGLPPSKMSSSSSSSKKT
mmetsp:Transcript_5255/g.16530  ORF Transcript_5255/g.16530 Transcript_5255/m.16530 type:complete len:298 (-) Transcript_5255:88-981(-)